MRAADWTGGVGETWAREWRRTDRSFAALDAVLESAILASVPASPSGRQARLVDLGCGAGSTSLAIAAACDHAEVVGLDLSPELVAVAAGRAAAATDSRRRCRFLAGDAAERVAALAPVDLFFSRHGVMFFPNPVAAFARCAAAAAPGARLVFSCFAAASDNAWARETLAAIAPPPGPPPAGATPQPGPFAFADPARVRAILIDAGWTPAPPQRVAFRYVAGAGADPIADAVDFFTRIGPVAASLRAAPADARSLLLDALAAVCRRHLTAGEVAFPATAWLWSAQLQEPAR